MKVLQLTERLQLNCNWDVMNEYVAEDKNKQQYMDLMNTELIDRYWIDRQTRVKT